jgi:photosystem II stability/assembly factor-like uncharacterized protein
MRAGLLCRLSFVLLACFLVGAPARAAQWFALGPYGGDARSFAVDPHDPRHLYLGTITGWLYQSRDGGSSWKRIGQIDGQNDLVIQHIVMDPAAPSRIIVGAYTLNHTGGGIFLSDDEGRHWTKQAEMSGQSVRSVARSQSDPNLLVAGTLEGVFRSKDDGKRWERISPQSSTEIHEVESIAIDPKDPNVIYAGTWHLPWKTVDGGAHWENIKQGIIDDSDVFSIVIDPTQPNVVYASACSGIYKSMDAGGQFKGGVSINKGQGIPSSARRTRKLKLDPTQPNTIYAGTTEGLFKSTDAGATWVRVTRDDVIINDVYVDPNQPQHVLLATDRGGVLRSEDGGLTFVSSNNGFTLRQVVAYTADPHNPAQLYVGVVNDKETGGVFGSSDGGVRWQQMSDGLGGRDVFSLTVTPDGTLLAGTSHGIFRNTNAMWAASTAAAAPSRPAPAKKTVAASHTKNGAKGAKAAKSEVHDRAVSNSAHKAMPSAPTLATAAVYALTSGSAGVYAGTSAGLWRSLDGGASWSQFHVPQLTEDRYVTVHGPMIAAASLTGLALSQDAGQSWTGVMPPPTLTQIGALAIDGTGNIWIGGPEGVFYSTDRGASWKTLRNLFVRQVDGIFYDAANKRVLVTSATSTVGFAASVPDYKVNYWDTGWTLRFLRPVGDHLVGATLFDGIVVEPKMVESPFGGNATASIR